MAVSVLLISGSTREGSTNTAALRTAAGGGAAPGRGAGAPATLRTVPARPRCAAREDLVRERVDLAPSRSTWV